MLHLEPTTACNAACPQCARENTALFDPRKHNTHLTVTQIRRALTIEQISRLEKMFMCGNFGDPAASPHTLEIYRFFRAHNPNITLGMNSNGAVRSARWWQDLAGILNKSQDYVIFSIDGLADTNHVYRRGVRWSTLMTNVKSFIDAGGSAHWDMLLFEHNQHQVDLAEDLARKMGFRWFRVKVSKRFQTRPIEWLSPPRGWSPASDAAQAGPISCHAVKEDSRYLAATGDLLPCCFFGNSIFLQDSYRDQLLASPGHPALVDSWSSEPHQTCMTNCREQQGITRFEQQWRVEKEL